MNNKSISLRDRIICIHNSNDDYYYYYYHYFIEFVIIVYGCIHVMRCVVVRVCSYVSYIGIGIEYK